MSVKNKATDRNERGAIARKYTGPGSYWNCWGAPGWWVSLYMTRPRRRQTKALCHAVKRGDVDADEALFPLGNHKPHIYFW